MFARLGEGDPWGLPSRRFLFLLYGSLRDRCQTKEALEDLENKLIEVPATSRDDMRAALTRAGMSEVQAQGALEAAQATTPEDRIRARIRAVEAAKAKAVEKAAKAAQQ